MPAKRRSDDQPGKPIPCGTCGVPKPWDRDHFYVDKGKPGGLGTVCKGCVKARAAAHYEANRARLLAGVAARQKSRREAGLPAMIDPEKQAVYEAKNRDRCRRIYHKDVAASRAKERARKRTEADRARRRRWAAENPGKIRANNNKRRGWLTASADAFTAEDLGRARAVQRGLCYYCGRRMAGRGRLRETVEHKTPVSRGGSNGPDNIVLACWECNMAKNASTEAEFLARPDRPGRAVPPRQAAFAFGDD